MKFVSNTHDCGEFFLCAGWLAAGHTFKHGNTTIVHQALYCQKGGGLVNGTPLSKFTQLQSGQGRSLVYQCSQDADTLFVAVAHKLDATAFEITVLAPETTQTITGRGTECYIASLENKITAAGKIIGEFNFARIAAGQEVSVSVPNGSFGIVLTR